MKILDMQMGTKGGQKNIDKIFTHFGGVKKK